MMKTNVFVLGDVQFQALNEWNYDIGNKFLDWFEELEIPENSYLIQAGDMTEKDTNPGDVVRQLERFFSICLKKFKKSFILVGNHDIKLYHGKRQISFAFAEEKNKIEVVKSLQNIEIDGMNILAMPHLAAKGKSLHSYYNDKTPEEYLKLIKNGKSKFDLCVGHWQKQGPENSPEWFRDGINTSNIPTNKFMLGHIHDRPDTDYLGSIWPLKVSEEKTKFNRVIGIMSSDNGEISYSEINIPKFCKYVNISYPDPVEEKTDSLVYIYTIDNCKNINIARDFYKDIYIRSTGTPPKEEEKTISSEEEFTFKDFNDAFKKFLVEKKPKINRNVIKIITNCLS